MQAPRCESTLIVSLDAKLQKRAIFVSLTERVSDAVRYPLLLFDTFLQLQVTSVISFDPCPLIPPYVVDRYLPLQHA
jgi:hypothetical protein